MRQFYWIGLLGWSMGVWAETPCSFLSSQKPCMEMNNQEQISVYTRLSFLYWACGEKGLEFAVDDRGSSENSRLKPHKPSVAWSPAFRVLVGGHLPYDGWDLDGAYSWFLHHSHQQVVDDSAAGILSVWTSPGAFLLKNLFARWGEASCDWGLHVHQWDLLLRRNLQNGKALSFQIGYGCKAALFIQRYHVSYMGGNVIGTETLVSSLVGMHERAWNVGPEFCCGSQWDINDQWNVFGSLSGALMAAYFHVNRAENDQFVTTKPVVDLYSNSDQFWTYRLQGALALGIQWGHCSKIGKRTLSYHVGLSYEAQYWWKQNMFLRHYDAPIAQSQTLAPSLGDLFFQGITADLLFDF